MMADYGDEDTRPTDVVADWLSKLDTAKRDDGMSRYEERCNQIRHKYRYEGSALVRTRKYQMLWSNIQTMQSAIYSKPPHAVATRRFRDPDPVARVATEVIERAINFAFDATDFDTEFKMVRDDFLLYARGVARVYYEPEYETEDDENEDISDAEDIAGQSATGKANIGGVAGPAGGNTGTGAGDLRQGPAGFQSIGGSSRASVRQDGESARSAREPKLKFENVRIRFVQHGDFRHEPARVWSECQWVAFRAFMTRAEVKRRFGEKIGKDISVDTETIGEDYESSRDHERSGANAVLSKATIWEIWDKAKNRVLWISPGYPDVLEEGDPYLDLDGFYPCPRPAYGTLTPDSLVPVPDFVFYQDQVAEIDQLTARIGALNDSLKLVGFYPMGPQGEGAPEIERALQPGFENKMIAVTAWSTFLEGGGGKGPPVVWLPIDQVMTIVQGCIELRKQLIEDVYQIIGISDIMRGATDPQETEGAQQLKAQYGGTRVKDRQDEIARFCRDIARLVGQIIAQHCSPQTIMEMTNIKIPTRAEAMTAKLMASARQMQTGPPMQPAPGGPQRPGLPSAPIGRPMASAGPVAPPQGVARPLVPIGAPR